MLMSMPARIGSARGVLLVRRGVMHPDQFSDVFPVGDDHPVEAKLAAEDVVQQPPVDVSRDAVDLAGIDHHRQRASLDGRRERRQEALPHRHSGISAGVRSWPLVGTL